jgi:hypothetical protein
MNPASSIDSDHVYGKIQVQPRHHSLAPAPAAAGPPPHQKKQRLSVRIPNRCHEVHWGAVRAERDCPNRHRDRCCTGKLDRTNQNLLCRYHNIPILGTSGHCRSIKLLGPRYRKRNKQKLSFVSGPCYKCMYVDFCTWSYHRRDKCKRQKGLSLGLLASDHVEL